MEKVISFVLHHGTEAQQEAPGILARVGSGSLPLELQAQTRETELEMVQGLLVLELASVMIFLKMSCLQSLTKQCHQQVTKNLYG